MVFRSVREVFRRVRVVSCRSAGYVATCRRVRWVSNGYWGYLVSLGGSEGYLGGSEWYLGVSEKYLVGSERNLGGSDPKNAIFYYNCQNAPQPIGSLVTPQKQSS